MAQTMRTVSQLWSNAPEIRSELINDQVATDRRMADASRAILESWYKDRAEVVFDKGRGWNTQATLFHYLYPEGKMLVCVRDLREIFASVERQHRANPVLSEAQNPLQETTFARADSFFSPQGLIGHPVVGVEDLLRNHYEWVYLVQYETFVKNPTLVMDRVYAFLGEEPFAHNFENVENKATDTDALYLNKFPHKGEGKIEERKTTWQEVVPQDIAGLIMNRYANYNRELGYR